jgi:dUTP pyrophosphatase
MVVLINLSNENVDINSGDRICQMIINKYEKARFEEVIELNETKRGKDGFGHTGNK